MSTVQLNLAISSDNDSVQDGKHKAEIARMLRELALAVESDMEGPFTMLDSNGNKVGFGVMEVWG